MPRKATGSGRLRGRQHGQQHPTDHFSGHGPPAELAAHTSRRVDNGPEAHTMPRSSRATSPTPPAAGPRSCALGPVAAGGSAAGERAVEFAFAEAELRKAPLVALHAWTTWNAPLPAPQDASAPYANPPGVLAEEEERLLSEALAGHRTRYPGVVVGQRVVHGRTREVLIDAGRSAQLVVVGARGRGGFTGLLLGSVSQALLHHAHCPVAVVRAAGARD